MHTVSNDLARGLFEWRDQESDSGSPAIGKRIVTEAAIIPCLAVAIVESAVRAVFVGFSCLKITCCGDCGSSKLLTESLHHIPIFTLALIDNMYARTVDKDNG